MPPSTFKREKLLAALSNLKNSTWGAVILTISGAAVIGISQPLLWPGGWGIGPEKTVTTTSVEKDKQGNVVKTIEVTQNTGGKTFWDLLSLAGVPLSLAILGYWLQQNQQKRAEAISREQRELAADETKEEVLQAYFDRISALVVDKNVLAIATKLEVTQCISPEEKELLAAAGKAVRARTLSILRRFENDPERKTSVIRFLIETDIVSKLKVNLSDADLQGTNLRGTNLQGANFQRTNLILANLEDANLQGANLQEADLQEANLQGANLQGANFQRANLILANLEDANLRGTNLQEADLYLANLQGADFHLANLYWANLKRAKNVRDDQLDSALLCQTKLPTGSKLDPDRDRKEDESLGFE